MELRKEVGCCFTGHRQIPATELPGLMRLLEAVIVQLYELGIVDFYCGGALGFDTLAAEAVRSLRTRCPGMRLIIVSPCDGQESRWPKQDRARYRELRRECDRFVCLASEHHDGCMRARNRYLVEHSAVCVAYITRQRSGAGQTVRMALARGLSVMNLAGWVNTYTPTLAMPRS